MNRRLPPSPKAFRSLEAWAEQLYQHILADADVATRQDPRPIVLPHKQIDGGERAGTDGVLLYDPLLKAVVVSQNGVWEPVAMEQGIYLAERQIFREHGDLVSVARTSRMNNQFGRNDSLTSGVPETVWQAGGTENYPPLGTNPINRVVSDNAADTSQIDITTFVDNGFGGLTRVVQRVTLGGTTAVALTPCARAERIRLVDGEAALVGNITVFESVTPINVHVNVAAGEQQSYKMAQSTASNEYLIITAVEVGMSRSNAGAVDFVVESRRLGSPFMPMTGRLFRRNDGTTDARRDFNSTPLILRPNSDVRVVATASANGIGATATLFGHYAEII